MSVGDEVRVEIDAVRRMQHARVHSAGHLLDSALANLGVTDLIPSKVIPRPEAYLLHLVSMVTTCIVLMLRVQGKA